MGLSRSREIAALSNSGASGNNDDARCKSGEIATVEWFIGRRCHDWRYVFTQTLTTTGEASLPRVEERCRASHESSDNGGDRPIRPARPPRLSALLATREIDLQILRERPEDSPVHPGADCSTPGRLL